MKTRIGRGKLGWVASQTSLYVLHCFQKKSVAGIATPKPDLELIRSRLKTVVAIEKELRK
jgi:phage-related protein